MIELVQSNIWFMVCGVLTGLSLDALWLCLVPLPLPYPLKWLLIFMTGHFLMLHTVEYNNKRLKKNMLPPPHYTWIITLFHPILFQEMMNLVSWIWR